MFSARVCVKYIDPVPLAPFQEHKEMCDAFSVIQSSFRDGGDQPPDMILQENAQKLRQVYLSPAPLLCSALQARGSVLRRMEECRVEEDSSMCLPLCLAPLCRTLAALGKCHPRLRPRPRPPKRLTCCVCVCVCVCVCGCSTSGTHHGRTGSRTCEA